MRDQAAPPFQAIFQEVALQVIPQKWPKEGRTCLKVQGDVTCLDVQFPLYFQGQECFALVVTDNLVHLDRHVRWKDISDWLLKQRKAIADPTALHATTAQAWSKMWLRNPIDDVDENWNEALEGLRSLNDFPTLHFSPLDPIEWKRHAAGVSRKSARGACAYTGRELVLMPDPLLQWLLAFLSAIEEGRFQWPRSLMLTRVVMLAKTHDQPVDPLQTRPITIASRIYRNWAKYRSAQIIQHVSSLLPPQIAGTASGVSSDLLSASLLWEIECALQTNNPRMGVTVDLLKCFNMIPRRPVLHAMRRLGVPCQFVTALESMFKQLRRVLDIAGVVGDPLQSSTGVPEGGAMLIIAMLALTAWVSDFIQVSVGSDSAVVLAYADNWAFLANSIQDLRTGLDAMEKTVTAWKMQISTDKSWAWATHARQRSELATLCLNGRNIPIKLVSEELGCDVSYCRRISKKVSQKRISKASRIMKWVATKKLPRKFKIVMSK